MKMQIRMKKETGGRDEDRKMAKTTDSIKCKNQFKKRVLATGKSTLKLSLNI